MNSRAIAANILLDVVVQGKSLNDAFSNHIDEQTADLSLIKQLCYGSLRHYFYLKALTAKLVDKPVKDRGVEALIMLGLYQLMELQVAKHAACSETVAAAKQLHYGKAAGLINAVLRRYLREAPKLPEKLTMKYNHPQWIIKQLQQQWPQHWQQILVANNQHPPMILRVNQQRCSRNHYLELLQQHGISATAITGLANAILLTKALSVNKLPGFWDGLVSVQDSAPQLAAKFIDLKPGLRVLDACAAPGGKTAHLLETQPDINLLALELDKHRSTKITENLSRLKLSAKVQTADACNTQSFWDNKLFDRILLDTPCSGTGVIRRHPDIKLLRRARDIQQFKQQQWRLLKNLWPLLKNGGKLLYATCSIMREENDVLMQEFLQQHPDATALDLGTDSPCQLGLQLFPTDNSHDGFYYCLLLKSS